MSNAVLDDVFATAVTIRRARVSDASILCAAEREIAKTPGRLVSLPDELLEDNFARKIEQLRDQGTYIVAERSGTVVGHAFLDVPSPQRRLAHVRFLNLVVHAPYAGQGIGTELLRALQAATSANGIERIELRVRATNTAAVKLYKKCGFAEEFVSRRRIKLEDGTYLDDMSMIWFAPGAEP
jgi:ribosomal protein S18 acetylase RimI-like enzyme